MGIIKRMWRREENKNVVLMVYRNIFLGGGKSLVEFLFGRNLRINFSRGVNEKILEEFKKKDKELKEYQKGYTDKRRRVKRRISFVRGD